MGDLSIHCETYELVPQPMPSLDLLSKVGKITIFTFHSCLKKREIYVHQYCNLDDLKQDTTMKMKILQSCTTYHTLKTCQFHTAVQSVSPSFSSLPYDVSPLFAFMHGQFKTFHLLSSFSECQAFLRLCIVVKDISIQSPITFTKDRAP